MAVKFEMKRVGGHRQFRRKAPRGKIQRRARGTSRTGQTMQHVKYSGSHRPQSVRPSAMDWNSTRQTYRSLVPCLGHFVQFAKVGFSPAVNEWQARGRLSEVRGLLISSIGFRESKCPVPNVQQESANGFCVACSPTRRLVSPPLNKDETPVPGQANAVSRPKNRSAHISNATRAYNLRAKLRRPLRCSRTARPTVSARTSPRRRSRAGSV